MNQIQMEAAKKAMIEWLSDPQELGRAPSKIEYAKEFDLHDLHYYIFKFKKGLFGDWLLGVCGGYEAEELEHCGHVFSNFEKYDEQTCIEVSQKMVEDIRNYWMQQAELQKQDIQTRFEKNLKYISQTEINTDVIERQFVKSETRFYLTVGQIDCPTGKIIISDPLCYLATGEFSPQLAISIPIGVYPVEVSIYRNQSIGIRMCTARLKIKDTKAVRYLCAEATEETAVAKCSDGNASGFPVEAGMMSFCDAQVADEYRAFLGAWHKDNPGKNHYDDYFAAFFAKSEEASPQFQREGGDFIEWANPQTGNRMVMVASGFGDGFYQGYWGYDAQNEICELIVPLVNPDIFD